MNNRIKTSTYYEQRSWGGIIGSTVEKGRHYLVLLTILI